MACSQGGLQNPDNVIPASMSPMASSHRPNGSSDRESSLVERSRGGGSPPGQPVWLAWIQLSISTMLVVLFLVMLGKVHEQAASISELQQKLRTIENSRSQDRTSAMEQQLESMIQRLQSVEQVGEHLREVDRQQQAIKQDLQQLISTTGRSRAESNQLPSQAPSPRVTGALRSPSLPGSPRPSATVLRPPEGSLGGDGN